MIERAASRPIEDLSTSLPRARPIAEFLNYVAARYRMKSQGIHETVRHEIVAKLGIVGVQKMLRRRRTNVFVPIMTGMEQQACPRIDADVSDGKKQGASGLTMSFDAEQFARLIVLPDDRVEPHELASHAVARG